MDLKDLEQLKKDLEGLQKSHKAAKTNAILELIKVALTIAIYYVMGKYIGKTMIEHYNLTNIDANSIAWCIIFIREFIASTRTSKLV